MMMMSASELRTIYYSINNRCADLHDRILGDDIAAVFWRKYTALGSDKSLIAQLYDNNCFLFYAFSIQALV